MTSNLSICRGQIPETEKIITKPEKCLGKIKSKSWVLRESVISSLIVLDQGWHHHLWPRAWEASPVQSLCPIPLSPGDSSMPGPLSAKLAFTLKLIWQPKGGHETHDSCLPPRSCLTYFQVSHWLVPFWCQVWHREKWRRGGKGSEEAVWEGTFKKRRLGRAICNLISIPSSPLSLLSLSFFFLLLANSLWLLSHQHIPFQAFDSLFSPTWPVCCTTASHFFSIPLSDLSISLSPLPSSLFLNFSFSLTFPPAFQQVPWSLSLSLF